MVKQSPPKHKIPKNWHGFLGRYPGKTLNRIGAAIFGIWITSLCLDLLWPIQDRTNNIRSSSIETVSESLYSQEKVYLLICLINDNSNDAAEQSNIRKEATFVLAELRPDRLDRLIYFSPRLEIPNSLDNRRNTPDEIYRSGGLALVKDLILQSIGIDTKATTRYIELYIKDIAEITKSINGVRLINKGKFLYISEENIQEIFQIEQPKLTKEADLQIRIDFIRNLIKILYNQIDQERSDNIINKLLEESISDMSKSELEQIKAIFRDKKGFFLHEKVLFLQ